MPSFHIFSDFSQQVFHTSFGIHLTVRETSRDRITRSSIYPSNGIKSGIKSIGDRAYATVTAAKNFAYHGVSGFFIARKTAGTYVFSFFSFSFKMTSLP